MRRLYLQVYLALLAVLIAYGLAVTVLWFTLGERPGEGEAFDIMAELAAERLPAAAGEAVWARELGALRNRLDLDLALYDAAGALLWQAGQALPPPPLDRARSGWMRGAPGGPVLALRLPDGRWLLGQREHDHDGRWIGALALLLGLLGLAAYPLARRLTRRLEDLRRGVDAFGGGDLSARVVVRGRDEIAAVATGFNTAADRIERLVDAQRQTLAGASHELRTPLARLRVALEIAGEDLPATRAAEMRADIAELDDLVGELLLVSRLQAGETRFERESVDLLGLAAELCAQYDARLEAEPVEITGDARLLRRLLRNLLENARRYGGDAPTEVRLEPADGRVRLCVMDRGPGLDEAERARVFEPFFRSARVREAGPGGVGIGLSLVRDIARGHGGEAVCRARPGGGLSLEVELPLG